MATQLVKSAENSISRDTIRTYSNREKANHIEALQANIDKIKDDLPQATALVIRLQILVRKLQ